MNAAVAPIASPLHGLRVVEFDGIGPGPMAGRLLAQFGAKVTLIVRPQADLMTQLVMGETDNPLRHGKQLVPLDLKTDAGRNRALDLIAEADVLIEGHRPGVMERLGLGPAVCAARNPRLVYGRMTGWGQHGPLAQAAGHDLNYVALSGLLSVSAHAGERPIVPPTVVGDASGALGLAFGIVCAVLDARRSGRGRVVDAAIVDITAMLGGLVHWLHAGGNIGGGIGGGIANQRPSAFHDSPFYDVYTCADGQHITVAALEPKFYALLLARLGLNDVDATAQYDTRLWPALKARIAALFRSQPRAHWCALLEGSDACFAPVLGIDEAARHPQHLARGTFSVSPDGAVSARAAPRFSALDATMASAEPGPGRAG
jgi:alpha-methylacyl-CoA racemase